MRSFPPMPTPPVLPSFQTAAVTLALSTRSASRTSASFVSASLLAVALAGASSAASAQVVAPGAGSLLQQLQPPLVPLPAPDATGLTVEGQGSTALPASAPFAVTTLRITGNTRFDTSTLHALVASGEGTTLTLPELGALAERITAYYQAQGYPLARAIVSAQVIRDGVVTLNVIEARYGQVELNNTSRASTSLLQATLAPLQADQVIEQGALDRSLLLLSDVPGVITRATLVPGQSVGTSDLQVVTTPGELLSGNVTLDNSGNRYTGRTRAGANLNVTNPLHVGDVLSLGLLSSGENLNYARLGYEALLNGQGTRLGASVSALRYRLGAPFEALDAHGTAQVASVWARQPLVRSLALNVSAQLQYDSLRLRDRVDASAIATDRHLQNWTASLSGDVRDGFLAGAVTSWSVGWTGGHVGFDNIAAQLADAATANTQGNFSRWNLALARLQGLDASNSVYLSVSGQGASGNLDSAQKMTVGGASTVRAYDSGTLSGDSGYFATLELRHNLGALWGGQWQAVAFADTARVTLNERVWVAGLNRATLSGAGLGLNWSGLEHWNARIYVAQRLGSAPHLAASGTPPSTRAWVEVSRAF